MSEIWRQKQLEYSWIRALTGQYRDFAAITEEALDFALATVAPEYAGLRQPLLEAYGRPEAYPEVRRALTRLKAGGVRTAILSNGTPAMLAAAVENAGIGDLIDAIFSVDELRTYKTNPRVYAFAADRLRLTPSEISFQSSNRWDIAGAVAAGFHAVWINRRDQKDEYPDLAPAAIVDSLDALPGPA